MKSALSCAGVIVVRTKPRRSFWNRRCGLVRSQGCEPLAESKPSPPEVTEEQTSSVPTVRAAGSR